MKTSSASILSLILLFLGSSLVSAATRDLVGEWTFDDPDALLAASVGNPLELVGTHVAGEGPEPGDGAVTIGVGSFYRCYHDISHNGGGTADWVNRFSIMMDVRIPQLGDWYCLYQTNYNNINDGEWFIHPDGRIGVGETGYSDHIMIPGEWYRLAISVSLGEHYDYYLDGQHLHDGGSQVLDGRFALYSAENGNQVLFFADENGEDNPIDVANVRLFDHDLTAEEITALGGYGHIIEEPSAHNMEPYLQTPTASSIHINWHTAGGLESVVEYGFDQELGQTAGGGSTDFGSETIWHHVFLEDLEPGTEYFYRCVTDTLQSPIFRFRTQPADDVDDGHIRFVVYGDNRTDVGMHEAVIQAMREKVVELYGEDIHSQLNLVLNVGDIVTTGTVLSQYRHEYFGPISPISGEVPFMVSIGNHEEEADHYYNYMYYDDFAGAEGERCYSFRSGPIRFIALNSNTQGETQLTWLAGELAAAQADNGIDWVFVYVHHPGLSEIWPDGNTNWIQDQVIPLLSLYHKAAGLFYGHSHNYERGIAPDSDLRLLLSGGGGSALDRWGMYGNQTDYPEIHRAHDYYCYVIFDIDCAARSYTAAGYSLGHTDRPMANELFDSFSRELDVSPPSTPTALAPVGEGLPAPRLTASPYLGEHPIMSSRFQLEAEGGDWSAVLVDSTRHGENVYGDTGSPDWIPVDLNEGLDLGRLDLSEGILTLGGSYQWRVRYRDRNLGWSDWSLPVVFTATYLPADADFSGEPREGYVPLTVRFTDLSRGEVLAWDWDLDGDGAIDSHDRDPVWTYPEIGDWTVSLTAHFSAEQITETRENYISVLSLTGLGQVEMGPNNLAQCRPNPFNPTTEIPFTLAQDGTVSLEIFDLQGRRVRELVRGDLEAGDHRRSWDGRSDSGGDLPSGLYLVRLKTGDDVRTRKAMLLK